jgi:hypothetical protein
MTKVNKNKHKEAQKTVRRFCKEFGLTSDMLNSFLTEVNKLKKLIF